MAEDVSPTRRQSHPFTRMETILHQLGDLVLGSVPTMILFLLLIGAYEALVQRPLNRILAERQARTSGAVEQARAALSAAEAETTVYEDKLRAAKAQLFADREKRVKLWGEEREAALKDVRQLTGARMASALHEIEQSATAARAQMEGVSTELSAKILRAVLPSGVSLPEAGQ